MKKLQLEQNTPEWLEFRKKKLGASDSPIIMGKNPSCTPYKLWRQKLDLDPPQFENYAMRQGKEKEEIARQEFIKRTGIEIFPDVRVSQTTDYWMASVDGISTDGKTLVEIKNPLSVKPSVVPELYKHQVQKQMYVYELERMIYFDYYSNFMIEVYRDDDCIKEMLEVEAIFWECLQTLSPPPLGDKDFVERSDFQWLEASKDYLETKKQLKELEEKEVKERQYLIQLAENQNCRGNGVTLKKVVRIGNMDYERIIEEKLKGVDLEPYRKNNIETWRLGVN